MKTADELKELKQEVEAVAKTLRQLTPEELEFVSGGYKVSPNDDESTWRKIVDWFFKIAN